MTMPRDQKTSRPRLTRGADGRLKLASGASDIGDVWAEQKRIRLHDTIEQDQKRSARQRRLFRLAKVSSARIKRLRPRIRVSRNKRLVVGGVVLVVVVAAILLGWLTHYGSKGQGEVARTDTIPTAQSPEYGTILPTDKTIESLGGWFRVSPSGKEPAFAYADKVGQVSLTVSEQPMPSSFKPDVDAALAKLARDFNANTKLTAGELTAYVGTSINGPQSLLVAKKDLLILIKSDAQLTDQQWIDYVTKLN